MIATDSEIIVYDWLTKRLIEFDFQSTLIGGRAEFGGIEVPFILGSGIALRILEGEENQSDRNAVNKLHRTWLEDTGYRVVDIQDKYLKAQADEVLERAVEGWEMSPLGTDLYRGRMGDMKGFSIHPKNPSAIILPSHATPIVRTDRPDIAASVTLNGALAYDGGLMGSCRFTYGAAKVDSSSLCWMLPFDFIDFYYLNSVEITMDFVTVDTYNSWTDWHKNKITGDTFSDIIPLASGHYNYKSQLKNPAYNVDGNDVIFKV